MAFLDSLTDAFTGKPVKDAAAQQQQLLYNVNNAGQSVLQHGQNQGSDFVQGGAAAGRSALNTGYGSALGSLGTGYDAAGRALTGAYNAGQGAIGGSTDAALGYVNQGTQDALGRYGEARSAYDPLSALGQKYGAGTSLYLDALGINGAEGLSRAQGAFQPTQGYQFNLDQGLDAINRARNARGMANSGNTDRDAQTFGAGLASQEYNKWLANLQGLVNPELQATGGAASGLAGVAGQEAGLLSAAGTNRANIEANRGRMLSDLAQVYGTGQAGLATGQGGAEAGLYTGQAGALAGLETGAAGSLANLATQGAQNRTNLLSNLTGQYNQATQNAANAEMQGSTNLLNLGTNLIKTAAPFVPGYQAPIVTNQWA